MASTLALTGVPGHSLDAPGCPLLLVVDDIDEEILEFDLKIFVKNISTLLILKINDPTIQMSNKIGKITCYGVRCNISLDNIHGRLKRLDIPLAFFACPATLLPIASLHCISPLAVHFTHCPILQQVRVKEKWKF